jgi:hypothetical protein
MKFIQILYNHPSFLYFFWTVLTKNDSEERYPSCFSVRQELSVIYINEFTLTLTYRKIILNLNYDAFCANK